MISNYVDWHPVKGPLVLFNFLQLIRMKPNLRPNIRTVLLIFSSFNSCKEFNVKGISSFKCTIVRVLQRTIGKKWTNCSLISVWWSKPTLKCPKTWIFHNCTSEMFCSRVSQHHHNGIPALWPVIKVKYLQSQFCKVWVETLQIKR